MDFKLDKYLPLVHDDVLIRSVCEYRHTLSLLKGYEDEIEAPIYIDLIRRDLATLENELRARGLDTPELEPNRD